MCVCVPVCVCVCHTYLSQTAHFLVELLRNLALPPASATPSVRPHKRSRTTPSPALLGFIDGVELFVGHGQGNRAKVRTHCLCWQQGKRRKSFLTHQYGLRMGV